MSNPVRIQHVFGEAHRKMIRRARESSKGSALVPAPARHGGTGIDDLEHHPREKGGPEISAGEVIEKVARVNPVLYLRGGSSRVPPSEKLGTLEFQKLKRLFRQLK